MAVEREGVGFWSRVGTSGVGRRDVGDGGRRRGSLVRRCDVVH